MRRGYVAAVLLVVGDGFVWFRYDRGTIVLDEGYS